MKSRKKVCLFMLLMTLGVFNIISNDTMAEDMYIDDEPMLVQEEEIKGNKEAYDKAVEAISQKDFKSAITYLSAYIASKPKKYEAYKLRGDAYYALRQYSLAQDDYKTAIDLKSGDDKFLTGTKYISAVVLGADKDEQLQNPELGNLYARLMYAQKALNDPAYETSYAQATQYNSHIYLPLPKKEDIAKVNCPQKYGKVLNPAGIDSYIYGAIEDIEKENYREAVFKSQHITSNYPDYYLGYYLTGVALLGVGQEKEAVDAFNIAISKNQYDFESLASLGQLYYSNAEKTFSAADAKKSNEYFNKALKYNPNCYRYYFYIGLNELQTGNFTNSINNFNKAIRLKQNDYSSMYYKLIAQYAKGDYRAVLDGCTNLLFKRVSNYNSVLYLRALAYNKLKSYDYALSDIDTIQSNINDIYNADIKVVSEKEKTLENYLYYLKAQIMNEQGYGARADMLKAVQNPIIAKLSEVEQAVKGYSKPLNSDIITLEDYKNYNNFYNTELPNLLQSDLVITVDDIDNQYDYLRTTFDNLGLTFVYTDSGYKLATIDNYAYKTYAGKLSAQDLGTLTSIADGNTELQVEKPVLKKVSSDSDIIGDMTKMSIAQMLASNSLPVMNTQKLVTDDRQSLLDLSEPELLTQNNTEIREANKVNPGPADTEPEQISQKKEELPNPIENKTEEPLVTETPDSIKVEAPVQKTSQTFEISYPKKEETTEKVAKVEETAAEITSDKPVSQTVEDVTTKEQPVQKQQPEKVSTINEKYAEVNPADYSLAVKSKQMPVIDESAEVIELELDNKFAASPYLNVPEFAAGAYGKDTSKFNYEQTSETTPETDGHVAESSDSETDAVIVNEVEEQAPENVAVPVVIVPELNIPQKTSNAQVPKTETIASKSAEQIKPADSFDDFVSNVKEQYSDKNQTVKNNVEIAENANNSVVENNAEIQNTAEIAAAQPEQIQTTVDEKTKRKADKEFYTQLEESKYINLADDGMKSLNDKAKGKQALEAEKLAKKQEKSELKAKQKAEKQQARLEAAKITAEAKLAKEQQKAEEREILLQEKSEQKARKEAEKVQKNAELEAAKVQRVAELAAQKAKEDESKVQRAAELAEQKAQKEAAKEAEKVHRTVELAAQKVQKEELKAQRAAELVAQKTKDEELKAQHAAELAEQKAKENAVKEAEKAQRTAELAAQKVKDKELKAQRAAELAEQKARVEAEKAVRAQEKELAAKAAEDAKLYQAQQKEVERQVALTRKAAEAAAEKEQREADLIRKEAERKAAEEAKLIKLQQKKQEHEAELAQKAAENAAEKERREAEKLVRAHDQELLNKAAAETKRLQAEEKLQKQAELKAQKAEQKAKAEAEKAVRAQEKELAAKAAEETRRLEQAQKAAERELQRAKRVEELEAQKAQKEAAKAQRAAQLAEQKARREAENAELKSQKEAAEAQREAQLAEQKARREAENAELKSQKEAAKAQRAAQLAEQKALREAENAELKSQKEAEKAQRAAQLAEQKARRKAENAELKSQKEVQRAQREAQLAEQKAREEAVKIQRAAELAEQKARNAEAKAEQKAQKAVEKSIKQEEKKVAIKSAQEAKEYQKRQKEYERQVAAAKKAVALEAKKEQHKADLINRAEEKAERKANLAHERKTRAYEKEVLSQVRKDAKEREALQKAAERQARKDKIAAAKAAEKDRIASAKLAKTKDKVLRERAAAETKSYLDYERKMQQERLKAEKARIAAQKEADRLVKEHDRQVLKNIDKELKAANAQKKAAEKIAQKERKEAIKAAKAQEIANQKHLKSLISEDSSEHNVGLKKKKKKFNLFGWFKKSGK